MMITAPQVLCLGEMLYDCLADQSGFEFSQVQSWTRYPGGAPANVACGLVKLGIPAGFIGCVGDDGLGQALTAVLQAVGVELGGLQVVPGWPTRQVYVTRTPEGERQFAGFGATATTDFADTQLRADLFPAFLFQSAQYLVLGTLGLASHPSAEAIRQALQQARGQQVQIFLDINWRPVFWPEPNQAPDIIKALLKDVDILKCTDEEAEWLFHTTDPQTIQNQYPNLRGVLVTAGAKGCSYHLGAWGGHIPAFAVAVQDTTGAGDAFVAGFLAQVCTLGERLWQEASLASQAIRYASAVGALTTRLPGAIAAQPTFEQVQTFLAQAPRVC
ncbi:carbohydrate kinase [Synechocystis sp. LKSZ1]|uniref:carbohydrate kinase family protein n=1 Tax=Synechocystis sp. LKSZ1 TaxID=3144951 RepID=UPI00336C1C40